MSHIILRNEIYNNWGNFNNHLNAGLGDMKKYLCDLWNGITEKNIAEGFVLSDKNRIVTEDDFNVTMNKAGNIKIFYLILPEPDSIQAQAKCVALALTPKLPRYFTMEIEEHYFNKTSYYLFGEWIIENGNFVHRNYGKIPNGTIDNFSYHVTQKLTESNR